MSAPPIKRSQRATPQPSSAAPPASPSPERKPSPAQPGKGMSRQKKLQHLGLGALLTLFSLLWFLVPPTPDPSKPPTPVISPSWWCRPLEINPVGRLPALPLLDLKAICANNDGKRAWAVGDEGMIVLTKDGGCTWAKARINWDLKPEAKPAASKADDRSTSPKSGEKVPPPAPLDKSGSAPPPRASQSSTSPASEMLKEKETGGAMQESPIVTPPAAGQPNPGAAPVASTGEREHSPADSYGGETIPPPDEVHTTLSDIIMNSDGMIGCAVGRYETVLHTSDGGETWRPASAGVAGAEFTQVMLKRNGPKFAAFDRKHGQTWTSQDGATWDLDASLSPNAAKYAVVDFDDNLEKGLAVSYPGKVLKSGPPGEWKENQVNSVKGYPIPLSAVLLQGRGTAIASWHIGGTFYSQPDGNWAPSDLKSGRWIGCRFDPTEAKVLAIVGDPPPIPWGGSHKFRTLESRDFGATWQRIQSFASSAFPRRCDFSPDGRQAWLACDAGGIYHSADGGSSFQPVTQNALSVRQKSLKRSNGDDFLREDGSPFLTSPTFTPAFYLRLPPPLFILSLTLIGLVLVRPALKADEVVPDQTESIADLAVSDAPVKPGGPDVTDLASLAGGLSHFILNPDTGAPLCLAINGEWGSGKSSLMGLVKARLEEHGYRPVWFNAWHHQKEEQLLAALVDSLQKDCPPPLFSPRGIVFRARLGWLRLDTNWTTALFWAVVAAAGVGWAWANAEALEKLFTLLIGSENKDANEKAHATGVWENVQNVVKGLVAMGLLGKPAVVLLKSFKAFGLDPSKLMADSAANAKTSDLRDKTSFRYQFAQEFREVTQALQPDSRLVIFVDDLDRCQPDQMLVMLEDINFLVSAGDCIIVLGMEEVAVRDCIAIQMEGRLKDDLEGLDAAAKRAFKRAYVDKWMEKLVQVRITVPTLSAAQASALLTGVAPVAEEAGHDEPMTIPLPTPPPVPAWKRRTLRVWSTLAAWFQASKMAWRIALGLVLVCFAFHFGQGKIFQMPFLTEAAKTTAQAPSPAASPQPAPTKTEPASSAASPITAPAPKPAASAPKTIVSQTIIPGGGWQGWLWVPLFLLGAFIVIAWPAWRIFIRLLDEKAADSPEFKAAVEAWVPLFHTLPPERRTPRSLKRFLNKVRFYAMLLRAQAPASMLDEGVETILVAYGAIEACYPDLPGNDWLDRLHGLVPDSQWAGKIGETMAAVEDWRAEGKARLFFRVKRAWNA